MNQWRNTEKADSHPSLSFLGHTYPPTTTLHRYEYPFDRFQEIARDYVVFLRDFAARNNGFTITGAGIYIVERIPEKPHGWFSQQGKGFDFQGYVRVLLTPPFPSPSRTLGK